MVASKSPLFASNNDKIWERISGISMMLTQPSSMSELKRESAFECGCEGVAVGLVLLLLLTTEAKGLDWIGGELFEMVAVGGLKFVLEGVI